MRDEAVTVLRCPRCDAEGALRLEAVERDQREVRTGSCGAARAAPKLRPAHEVAEFDGYEHAFLLRSYRRAARRAGFAVEVTEPAYNWIFKGDRSCSTRRPS